MHEEGTGLCRHPGRGGADLDMVESKTGQDPSGQASLLDPAGSEEHRRGGGTGLGHQKQVAQHPGKRRESKMEKGNSADKIDVLQQPHGPA